MTLAPLRHAGTLAALAGIALTLTACPRKERPMPQPSDGPKIVWNEALEGSADARASASLLGAGWYAPMADEPAPGELVIFDRSSGASLAKDRGWFLRLGDSVADSLVVDEAAAASYVVRRFGVSGGLALPAPDDGVWPLRGAVCGRSGICAVARWSPAGAPVAVGAKERLAITAVDARALRIVSETLLELPDLHAGTRTLGGIVAHPTRPIAYVIDRTPTEIGVREIDLAAGRTGWRAAMAVPAREPALSDVELIAAPDGTALLLSIGRSRWSYHYPDLLFSIDTRDGTTSPLSLPEKLNAVLLAAAASGSSVLVVDVASVRVGETPEFSIDRIAALDLETGTLSTLAARDKIPPGRGAVGPGHALASSNDLLLVLNVLRSPLPNDPSSPDVQAVRRAAVASLLAPRP